MKLFVAVVIAAVAGCGGGSGGGADGGGAPGDGGGGGGGTPIPCTISISGDVTTGTYHTCNLLPAPAGNNKVQIDGLVLTGCSGCGVIADFSQTPTDTCSTSGASMQVIDPSLWPDAIGMAATSTSSMSSCTITTSNLDVTGHHWSGTIDAFLVATDFSFNTVGFARVTVTGGF